MIPFFVKNKLKCMDDILFKPYFIFYGYLIASYLYFCDVKQFNIPRKYKSSFIAKIKEIRKLQDPLKKDFTPTLLDFGSVQFYLARHFGFCYGVENAIEISYQAIEHNPDKRIYLVSQMIHNPEVNGDLKQHGIEFIMDTEGNQLVPWDSLTPDDIVIIPAFGASLEVQKKLEEKKVEVHRYNTTCPFVEKVWKKSSKLGLEDCTVIIHGKENHEETRATFSHCKETGNAFIIRDIDEASSLVEIILNKKEAGMFYQLFKGRYSAGFDVEKDLDKIGIVNQTTMLASETSAIAAALENAMRKKYGEADLTSHFVNTRDTLCYATNDNQEATKALLGVGADFAIVVGGYNSSNTSHIVELCEQSLSTYFISSANEIRSHDTICHYDIHLNAIVRSSNYLINKKPIRVILTSGASCPDKMIEDVLDKILSFYPDSASKKTVLKRFLRN